MSPRRRALSALFLVAAVGVAVVIVSKTEWPARLATLVRGAWRSGAAGTAAQGGGQGADQGAPSTTGEPTVEVGEKGLRLLKLGTVGQRDFKREIRDVGVVDFNQDMTTPVFPSYQGKIIKPLVDLGDDVAKGQILYTIDSPDLLQAESTLIQTAGVLELSTRNLARLRQSVRNGGGAQKDLDQAVSDQQTAVGAYAAARLAVQIFGKTSEDADRIVATRTVDPVLDVKSPITGTITARNAAPGDLVQPGTAPAPYSVSDLAMVRLYDFVAEDQSPAIHEGQEVTGQVAAFPGRVFTGKVSAVAAAIDPVTHRMQVESLIPNPGHLLRPSMFANLTIRTAPPLRSAAVPTDAVVRLGDGTMTVWTTTDERHFTQRIVKVGLQQDRFDQILEGVGPGETIVTEGAVYVSNIANANASP